MPGLVSVQLDPAVAEPDGAVRAERDLGLVGDEDDGAAGLVEFVEQGEYVGGGL